MNPDTAHVIDASIPTGLNEDDNATLLQSLFLNDVQQMQAIRRNAYAQSMGQPVPPGSGVSGISVVHNHTYSPPPPVQTQQPPQPAAPANLATKLLAGGAIALASGLAGAGGLAYFRPSAPSSHTTTLTTPPPIVAPVIQQPPPAQDDSGYDLKVE